MSPVCTPVTMPAATPPMMPPDRAILVPLWAATEKIMLTAGAPNPALTRETVTHTRMTPVPMATFFSARS